MFAYERQHVPQSLQGVSSQGFTTGWTPTMNRVRTTCRGRRREEEGGRGGGAEGEGVDGGSETCIEKASSKQFRPTQSD